MTSLLLYFWLASAAGGSVGPASSGAAPTAPQAPAPPPPPAVNGPPIPALPTFPNAPHGSPPAPASKSTKKEPEATESAAPSETPADKHESAKLVSKSKKTSSVPPQGRGVPTLPTLTATALKNELRQSQPGSTDSAQVTERARLEQLSAEIAKAREALRQETAHLEDLIRQRGSCDGELRAAASTAAAAAGTQSAEAAAAKDADREQMESVSKAMKGMKPEQAAAVVTRLDHRLASEVLRRMRPADAGPILGFLKPELAAELATEIATHRSTIPPKKGASNP
jgi:flagellar motility protein MotE (MotC chaperone)